MPYEAEKWYFPKREPAWRAGDLILSSERILSIQSLALSTFPLLIFSSGLHKIYLNTLDIHEFFR
jgi:hypothetical protein